MSKTYLEPLKERFEHSFSKEELKQIHQRIDNMCDEYPILAQDIVLYKEEVLQKTKMLYHNYKEVADIYIEVHPNFNLQNP
jgi:archaellum component FlaC